jgi:drug/metabolite transporter (DMT)-like permease
MSMAATIFADETQISAMTVAGRAGPKKMSGLRLRNLVARGPSTVWRRSSRFLLPTGRTLARSWRALPLSVRAVLLMVTGSLLFSVMGALVKLLGQQIDSFQIAFFRCFFGFIAILPFVLLKPGRHAFRTTYFYGHFLRGALGVAAIVAGFYATTRLPLTDSTAISFTAPLFMILTAIFLLGEKVRWRRGLATAAGFIGVLVMVRPDSGTLDLGAMVGLIAAFLGALSTTLIKRLSATEKALTILVYFGLFSSILTAIPAYFVWRPLAGDEFALLALVGALGAVGQFCQVRAFAAGELMAVAPIDYSRLIFAGIMGFLLFAELPDRYTLVGAAMIVGSTLYIACRETHLSRLHRAALAVRPLAAPPGDADAASPGTRRIARPADPRSAPAGPG